MLTNLVIAFREVLEAALVIVVVLAYLRRTGQTGYYKNVWYGAAAGIILSVVSALLFNVILGGLDGNPERIFEGITMSLAVILLTWMIVWMMGKARIAKELETRVERQISMGNAFGISLLIATAVLREGVEMVIFLQAVSLAGWTNLYGTIAGAALAITIGCLLFTGVKKINIKMLFRSTGILLILFAAGLSSRAVIEFQEAGIVPPVVEPLYDITWMISKDGFAGGILSSLFGYTGRPNLTEMIGYLGYLSLTYLLYKNMRKVSGIYA
ncbi:MAG: FTR1 family protein [Deltaproteobacteria bacterium]|nr:FTR1 family protein [Deltaproteobacteria bacterium]